MEMYALSVIFSSFFSKKWFEIYFPLFSGVNKVSDIVEIKYHRKDRFKVKRYVCEKSTNIHFMLLVCMFLKRVAGSMALMIWIRIRRTRRRCQR